MSPQRRIRRERRNALVAGAAAGVLAVAGVLAAVLVVLKLCRVVGGSWWLILAPVWIPGGLLTLVSVMLGAGFFADWAADQAAAWARRRRRTGQDPRPDEHGPAKKWPRP